MANPITLQILLPYTDFMTDKEVERLQDYLAGKEPLEPFTCKELIILNERKEAYYHKLRLNQNRVISPPLVLINNN